MHPPYDAIIIGGGPAGLTGAIYLGRFRRRVLVIDAGDSRLAWIPASHNHPGFPDGVVGKDLLDAMQRQADRYGAERMSGRAARLARKGDLLEVELEGGENLAARYVLLAAGVVDNEVDLPDMRGAVKRGLLRMCPICDGYEVIDQAVGVLGDGPGGVREARFLQTYTSQVTLIHVGPAEALDGPAREDLQKAGVDLVETPIGAVQIEKDRIHAFDFGAGDVRRFDTVYSALGTRPSSELALALGAEHDPLGCMRVDAHQRTSVPGLYAAGDLVRGLNQISIAQAEGAIAATDIHNRLKA